MSLLKSVLLHWKTTTAGIAVIFTAAGDALTQIMSANIGSGQIEKDVVQIIAGIGLIFAADATGTVQKGN